MRDEEAPTLGGKRRENVPAWNARRVDNDIDRRLVGR